MNIQHRFDEIFAQLSPHTETCNRFVREKCLDNWEVNNLLITHCIAENNFPIIACTWTTKDCPNYLKYNTVQYEWKLGRAISRTMEADLQTSPGVS